MKANHFSETAEASSSAFISLSRRLILGTSLGVILFVGSLMVTLFNLDLESLFKGEEQAMKVGSIVVSFSDFSLLKRLSGREGTNFSNSDFASELLETMLWAEAGRKIGIDRQNLYLQKLQEFDSAVSEASDSAILSRALFLLEELARLTREFVQSKIPPPTDSEVEDYLRKNPEMISPEQIHVRTILVQNQSHAEQIFQEASAGNSFFSINASWSVSPYKGVGGDLGWVASGDLPHGVFQILNQTPIGSITYGFSDSDGVHLFFIEARPIIDGEINSKFAQGRIQQDRRKEALKLFFTEANSLIPYRIHPSLRSGTIIPGNR